MKKTIILSLITTTILMAENHEEHASHSFEPSIKLSGDFSYVSRSKELHETNLPGFTHAHEEEDGHDHSESNSMEGFNFNSAELEIEAPIDEHMEVRSTFHLGQESFEVEELYGTTHSRDGLNIKAGKFLSSFGLNNSKHSETWDFTRQALINNALFGNHGLNEKGIGLSWNNKNLTVEYELLSGENELSFGTTEIEDGNVTVEGANKAELNVLHARYNNRIDTVSYNTGISYGTGKARWDHTGDTNSHALTGDVKLTGLDMTFIIPFTRTSNLKWSTEYIKRKITNGTRHAATTTVTKTIAMDQSGVNTSLVYTINPKWKVGVEYDTVLKNDKIVDGTNTNKPDGLKRTSLMAQYNVSENNRLRLQYTKDDSQYHDDALLSYSDIILQWTFAFSTGEHKH